MPCPLIYTQYVLDSKEGDVNGDLVPDIVYVVGEKPFGGDNPYSDNIFIMVEDDNTSNCPRIPLKVNAGYNARVFLGDFNGDNVDDILVGIDTGGSGGYGIYYIYSFLNNQPVLLFDFEQFNREYRYTVEYRDYYKVEVVNHTLNKRYIIDISNKGPEYLSAIYNPDGRIKQPISGQVLSLGVLYPIDYDRDGTYDLLAIQRIIGRYNADTLGFVQTILKWDGRRFVPIMQYVAVPGATM